MPRFDKFPQKRGVGDALYNPLRSGLTGWSDPLAAIDDAAQSAGGGIRKRIEDTLDQALDGVVDAVMNLTGIDISGPVALLEQLLSIPLAFLGGSTSLGDAVDVLGQFFPFLPGANPGSFDPAAAASAFITEILAPTGLLAAWSELYQRITGSSGALDELGDLFQDGLFGQIAAGRLGQVSLASIDNLNPETLDNPGFDTDASIRDNDEAEWDGTFGRTRPGSMKMIGDGTTKTAVSNPLKVVQNRQVNVSIWTYFQNVTAVAGTTPIRLSVDAYNTAAIPTDPPQFVASTLIPAPSIASPAGNSSAVPGNVGGWILISGSYTVPAGVDRIVNKVQVTSDCTAGTVHFDDGSRKRAGLMPKEYVNGLVQALQDAADDLRNLIEKAWSGILGGTGAGKTADDLKAALSQIPQGNILGLPSALAAAGTDIADAIVHAMGGTGTGHDAGDVLAALVDIPNRIQHLNALGFFDATKLSGIVDPTKVGGIGGASNIGDAVQQAVDAMTQGAGGLAGAGFSFLDALAQLTGLRQATAGANAAVLNVQSQLAGLDPAASSEIINFSEYVNAGAPPSMFTKVFDQGSGGIVTSGGKLAWSGSAGDERYLFNGGPLQTDLFEVNVVLPTVPSHGWFGADGNNFIYLIGRSDAAGNNMCLAEIGWDRIRILSYNLGTVTVLATVNESDVVTGGCRVAFKGGNALQPRYFHVAVNDDIVTSATDIAPVTQLGSSFRLCGAGLKKDTNYDTGTISTWSMLDGGASAGSGTVVGYTAAGLTNLSVWRGNSIEYAAIPSKVPGEIYFVKNV